MIEGAGACDAATVGVACSGEAGGELQAVAIARRSPTASPAPLTPRGRRIRPSVPANRISHSMSALAAPASCFGGGRTADLPIASPPNPARVVPLSAVSPSNRKVLTRHFAGLGDTFLTSSATRTCQVPGWSGAWVRRILMSHFEAASVNGLLCLDMKSGPMVGVSGQQCEPQCGPSA